MRSVFLEVSAWASLCVKTPLIFLDLGRNLTLVACILSRPPAACFWHAACSEVTSHCRGVSAAGPAPGEIVWVHGLGSRGAGAESGDAAPCLLARALSPVVPREVPNMVRKADDIFW